MRTIKKRTVEYKGISLTIHQWIDKLGITNVDADCIYRRIFTYNWPFDQAFIDQKLYRQKSSGKEFSTKKIKKERVNRGIESWQELMLDRGYFRKENRIRVYKMLNAWYKEFRAQDMRAA